MTILSHGAESVHSQVNIHSPNCGLHGKQTGGVEVTLRIGFSGEPGVIFKGNLFCRQKVTAPVRMGGSRWIGRWIEHTPGQSQVS